MDKLIQLEKILNRYVDLGDGKRNDVRVRTTEKYRNVYSEQQRLELEKEYRTSTFINAIRKSELSTQLHLTERQVKIWFQNRLKRREI
ncbi:unnamed protein product [Dracunculus medinensis]|uniref:Homeobox domain-containing protein n=1 Tax=Dracunculus medinensis TaxID=318479 RepID=A0A0N4UJR2_DRAME|nr:unnamed protein product [Dracunculus medinensis]